MFPVHAEMFKKRNALNEALNQFDHSLNSNSLFFVAINQLVHCKSNNLAHEGVIIHSMVDRNYGHLP